MKEKQYNETKKAKKTNRDKKNIQTEKEEK